MKTCGGIEVQLQEISKIPLLCCYILIGSGYMAYYHIKKGKAISVTSRGGPYDCGTSRLSHFPRQSYV
jgi:hypothetical protein